MNAPYVSPHGKPRGLARRLSDFTAHVCSGTGRHLWAGLGIIEDLKLAAAILNKREFLESLRLSPDPDAQRFAAELLDDDETLEAVQSAADRAQQVGKYSGDDPVQIIEQLDDACAAARRDYDAVRSVLVETGALADDDTETPVADLLRALLA